MHCYSRLKTLEGTNRLAEGEGGGVGIGGVTGAQQPTGCAPPRKHSRYTRVFGSCCLPEHSCTVQAQETLLPWLPPSSAH